MQLVVDLPDELGQALLDHGDATCFIKKAIEKELLSERKIDQAEQQLFSLMASIPKSVGLVDELIQERRTAFMNEQLQNK